MKNKKSSSDVGMAKTFCAFILVELAGWWIVVPIAWRITPVWNACVIVLFMLGITAGFIVVFVLKISLVEKLRENAELRRLVLRLPPTVVEILYRQTVEQGRVISYPHFALAEILRRYEAYIQTHGIDELLRELRQHGTLPGVGELRAGDQIKSRCRAVLS